MDKITETLDMAGKTQQQLFMSQLNESKTEEKNSGLKTENDLN
jgi:hypothetical protein